MAYTRKSALPRFLPCYSQGICSLIGAFRSPLKMLSHFELSDFRCDGLYSQIRSAALLALLFAGHLLVNWHLSQPVQNATHFSLSGFRCDGLYSQIRAVALLALLFAGHLLVNWRLSQSAQNALAFFAVGLSPYHPAKIAYAPCKHGICHFCGMALLNAYAHYTIPFGGVCKIGKILS